MLRLTTFSRLKDGLRFFALPRLVDVQCGAVPLASHHVPLADCVTLVKSSSEVMPQAKMVQVM